MKRKSKILIVDDDEQIRSMLAEYLEAKGFAVSTSTDGWACLWDIVVGKPDAIVMDLEMPKIDGLTAMDMMKVTRLTEHIPVIVASAKGDKDTILKASCLGADDFIVKPYSFDELAERLNSLILPVDRDVLGELLECIKTNPRPIEEWPELNRKEYKAWNAYPILYKNRELCILTKTGVSVLQAKQLPAEEARTHIVVLARFGSHWKCVWPLKDPQMEKFKELQMKLIA